MTVHPLSEPTSEQLAELGFDFPQRWAAPVIRVRLHPEVKIVAFSGTATVLGDDLFLTAAHVLDDDVPEGEQQILGVVQDDGRFAAAPILQAERHPNSGTDLAIGRFGRVRADQPWASYGMASGWMDVLSFGYPDEIVRPTELRDYRFEGRCLKGYVMRSLDPSSDELMVTAPSLELSFPIPTGMSGSPIFVTRHGERSLCGIALGSREIGIAQHSTISLDESGATRVEERVERIVEVVVALRLSQYMHWPIAFLDDRTLGSLVPAPSIASEPASD